MRMLCMCVCVLTASILSNEAKEYTTSSYIECVCKKVARSLSYLCTTFICTFICNNINLKRPNETIIIIIMRLIVTVIIIAMFFPRFISNSRWSAIHWFQRQRTGSASPWYSAVRTRANLTQKHDVVHIYYHVCACAVCTMYIVYARNKQ